MSASHGAGRRMMSKEEVDRALERLGSEKDAIEAALLALQDHPGRRLLEGASLTGSTRHRWSAAEQGIALLWSMFQTYQEALTEAQKVRRRAGRRPKPPELAEITRILAGESITVPGSNLGPTAPSLTGSAKLSEQLSLAELLNRMNEWYARILEVVNAADAVWNELPSRLALLIAEAGRVRAQAEAVGLQAGRHPVADSLEQVCTDLERLRAEVHGDPLAFYVLDGTRSGHGTGHVDTGRFDRGSRELEDTRREVEALLRLSEDSEDRLAQIAETLGRADAELGAARRVRGEVLAKIAASDVPAVPGPPGSLYDRLATAEQYRRSGQWHRLSPQLDGLEHEAGEELRRARDSLASVRAPLSLRDELRGRLDAYHAKVGMKGRIEDPELAQAYQTARRMLWSAPCDLRAAEQSVHRYQQLIAQLLGRPAAPAPGPRDSRPLGY